MQYVCISRRLPHCDLEVLRLNAYEETQVAWRMHREGRIHSIHYDKVNLRGILFVNADSEAPVRALLAELPLMKLRQIEFEVLALGPYKRLEQLFKATDTVA